jgi:hypothetical protein
MALTRDMLSGMSRIAVLLFIAAMTASCDAFAQPAPEARRFALVIGNDRYSNIPSLRNARADATAVADALRESGFDVMARYDLDERSLRAAVREFMARLSGGDEAVFFYAGHGVQLGAANYLLPTDMAPDDEARVRDESLPLQRVLDDLTERRVRFSLAIIDACRNNPFPADRERSIRTGRGLAPTSPATGQMVMFSAGVGQTALDLLDDRDRSRNGLFTRVLLRELRKDGVPADQILRNVREEVVRLARSVGHEQVPALYDQSIGRFYLRRATGTLTDPSKPAAPLTAAAPLETASQINERIFWESVKDSRSPEELRAYLQRFPNGVFAELARLRIDALIRTPRPVAGAAAPSAPSPSPMPTAAPAPAPLAGPALAPAVVRNSPNASVASRPDAVGTLAPEASEGAASPPQKPSAAPAPVSTSAPAVATARPNPVVVARTESANTPAQGTTALGASPSPMPESVTRVSLGGAALPACPGNPALVWDNCLGSFTWPNGESYVGEYRNNAREGRGTYSWPDGRRYVGEYRANRAHGQGTYTSTTLGRYEGEFRDDKRHGRGTLTSPDGKHYTGEFRDGAFHGQGVQTWPDGQKYVGEFKAGSRDGQGTFTWADGRQYVGAFRDDKMNGRGRLFDPRSNTVSSGIFEADQMIRGL